MTSKYAWLFVSTCLAAACGGKAIGSNPGPNPGPPGEASAPNVCVTPVANGGTVLIECLDDGGPVPVPPASDASSGIPDPTPTDPDASVDGGPPAAVCGVTPGASVVFATAQSACDAFGGLWRVCSGAENLQSLPADVIGMEFGPAGPETNPAGTTTGGALYLLIQGPSGPVRGTGNEYAIKYDVSDEGPLRYQLNIHPFCGGTSCGFGGQFSYSAAPKLLEFQVDFGTGEVGLAPF
jgi:hypothetical protein